MAQRKDTGQSELRGLCGTDEFLKTHGSSVFSSVKWEHSLPQILLKIDKVCKAHKQY